MSPRPHTALDPAFREKVSTSFHGQSAMDAWGVRLVRVDPGEVELSFAHRPDLLQQHGFMHGGVLGAVLDTACGFASLSLMPAGVGVLTVEYKVNFVAPGRGDTFRALGRVRKAGRTITLAEAELFGRTGERERLLATMTATMMTVTGRDDVRD